MADVLPITVPSRAELWRRLQLARSILAQRESTPDTHVLLRVLDGVPLETLAEEAVRGA
ncbi:hypothetical protein [Kibdelosporangium aridum]|uniref:hypothetical protein n=1 Tax=Kibdelosporangium aridum TaxID=2030 RepID=UPI000B03876E|nr:hypothetical protein [Kibdelosporangium aridum]